MNSENKNEALMDNIPATIIEDIFVQILLNQREMILSIVDLLHRTSHLKGGGFKEMQHNAMRINRLIDRYHETESLLGLNGERKSHTEKNVSMSNY